MSTSPSILSPFQITATANLLYNQGLGINAAFLTNIASYESQPFVVALNGAIVAAKASTLPANTTAQLYNLATNTCPALSDSYPGHTSSSLFSSTLKQTAYSYIGEDTHGANKDLTKFCQGFGALVGYNGLTNSFISSAINSQTYLGGTYAGADNMVSGGITTVNICTQQWGQDLIALGGLINLSNLEELGTPLALVKQLAKIGGITPQLALSFTNAGVSLDTVVNLTSPTLTASDADQKAMYSAMTQITGTPLTQILKLFGVTTPNINTLADLLNPYKIFPNSFQTLTVTGTNGVTQNIYINSGGTVNSTVQQYLPKVAVSSLS